jgi:hypothetical protein
MFKSSKEAKAKDLRWQMKLIKAVGSELERLKGNKNRTSLFFQKILAKERSLLQFHFLITYLQRFCLCSSI